MQLYQVYILLSHREGWGVFHGEHGTEPAAAKPSIRQQGELNVYENGDLCNNDPRIKRLTIE